MCVGLFRRDTVSVIGPDRDTNQYSHVQSNVTLKYLEGIELQNICRLVTKALILAHLILSRVCMIIDGFLTCELSLMYSLVKLDNTLVAMVTHLPIIRTKP